MTKVGTRNAEPRRNSIRRPWRGIRRGWRLDRASEAVGSPLRADHDPRRGRDTRGNGMWGILRRGAERFMEAMGCMIAGVLHAEIEGIHPWTGRRGVRMVGILAGGGARMRRRWAVNGALLGVPVSVATLPARGPRGACLTPKSVQFSVAQEVPLPGTKSVQFLTPIDIELGCRWLGARTRGCPVPASLGSLCADRPVRRSAAVDCGSVATTGPPKVPGTCGESARRQAGQGPENRNSR